MTGYLGNAYYWVLAGHIIFIIFLMAGLFMMPGFFIYHQECAIGSTEEVRWIRRDGGLRKLMLNPSLVIVWIFGLMLAFHIDPWTQGWFQEKLLLVIILSGYFVWVVWSMKKL